jgi:DNA polymerase-4
LDEAYLDVTENKTGLPTATLVARTIREQISQELNLTASAGVATNKFLAKLASDWRKPDGLFVVQPDDIDSFLLPLPVERLPGVGKVTGEKLAKRGIQTVRDLRAIELTALASNAQAGKAKSNWKSFVQFAFVTVKKYVGCRNCWCWTGGLCRRSCFSA